MMSNRYNKYYKTPLSWAPELPDGWQIIPFKRLFSSQKGLPITKADLVSVGVPVISYGQIHSKSNNGVSVTDDLLRYVPVSYIDTCPSSIVKKGDFIFADTSEDLDGCGNCVFVNVDYTLFAGYHSIIARNESVFSGRYFAYLFQTDEWRSQIRSLVNGVKLYSITQPILFESKLIVPSKAEQERIADVLDERIYNIDSLIAKRIEERSLLQENRISVISEVITRGLNKNADFVDSGVEWIGKVPSSWEKRSIRFCLESNVGGVWGEDCKNTEDDIICVRVADFDYAKGVIYDKKLTKRYIVIDDGNERVLTSRDLLLEKSGGGEVSPVGRVVRNTVTEKSVCSNFVQKLSVKPEFDRDFLYYYFNMMYSKHVNALYYNQTIGIQNLQVAGYLNNPIFLPPKEEQEVISNYLNTLTEETSNAVARIEEQVSELKELRNSIISEAVLGKIDLSTSE